MNTNWFNFQNERQRRQLYSRGVQEHATPGNVLDFNSLVFLSWFRSHSDRILASSILFVEALGSADYIIKVNFHVVVDMEQSKSCQFVDFNWDIFVFFLSKIIYYEKSDRFL